MTLLPCLMLCAGVGEGRGAAEVGPLFQGVDVRKLADEFLSTLAVQGYSLNTIGSYRLYIEGFVGHLGKEGKDIFQPDRKAPDFVDYACLLRWMQAIRLRGVQESSLQGNKSAVSSWYKWLIRIGRVERNPIDMMPAIKVPETDPKPLPVSDMLKLLEGARSMEWERGHRERNLAIFETLYASGLRASELCNLNLPDLALDDDRPYLTVRMGKGKRDGLGRLTPAAVAAIKAYLPIRGRLARRWEKPMEWAPLFLSYRAERMDRSRIWAVVNEAGKKILGREIHPHQFRHSFCTDLLNRGANLESIRKLARHKRLETTQKYLDVSLERLDEDYGKHPRA